MRPDATQRAQAKRDADGNHWAHSETTQSGVGRGPPGRRRARKGRSRPGSGCGDGGPPGRGYRPGPASGEASRARARDGEMRVLLLGSSRHPFLESALTQDVHYLLGVCRRLGGPQRFVCRERSALRPRAKPPQSPLYPPRSLHKWALALFNPPPDRTFYGVGLGPQAQLVGNLVAS